MNSDKYNRIAEEFGIVHTLGSDRKQFSLRSAMMNVDSLLDDISEVLRLARCRDNSDCADPKGCVERMRAGIDTALLKLKHEE